jgi:hypothetical protein
MTVDESGGESSGQPEGAASGSEKGPHPTPEGTPSPQGKASSGSAKQVTMQHFSKQGSFLLTIFSCFFRFLNFDLRRFLEFFRIQGSFALLLSLEASALSGGLCAQTFYARESCRRAAC